MNFNKITISCATNPDIIGTWRKFDVEEEMNDILGYKQTDPTGWISWIISHTLDYYDDFDETMEKLICSDKLMSITLKLNGDKIVIKKEQI